VSGNQGGVTKGHGAVLYNPGNGLIAGGSGDLTGHGEGWLGIGSDGPNNSIHGGMAAGNNPSGAGNLSGWLTITNKTCGGLTLQIGSGALITGNLGAKGGLPDNELPGIPRDRMVR
jgi:hypothetical protein